MAKNKQLSVFWGEKTLFFTETLATTTTKCFNVAFGEGMEGSIQDGKYIPADMHLVTPIHNVLRHQEIDTPTPINLSLPTTDIIFRTFVIPWMPSGEVAGVVEFEISKYIPFSLDDLSYSFYPMTTSINGVKRIRIIFVAIKNTSLDKYLDILEKSGFLINLVEPAPVSLIRTLSFKGIIPPNQIIAIVEKETDKGRIVIVDQGTPLFVRDFHLRIPENQQDKSSAAQTKMLINELRISLDYFNRQNNQVRVKEILLISTEEVEIVAARCKDDLEMDVTPINSQIDIGGEPQDIISNMSSFGAGIFQSVYSRASFNLIDKTRIAKGSKSFAPISNSINLKTLAPIIAACIILCLTSFTMPNIMLSAKKNSIASLKKKLADHKDVSTSKLKEKDKSLNKKIKNISNIRTESDIAFFLSAIPKLLPEGVWVNKFSINYKKAVKKEIDKKKTVISPRIEMTGHSFSDIPSQQFAQVNEFLSNLKEKDTFSRFFKNIDLKAVTSKTIDAYEVKSFSITCN